MTWFFFSFLFLYLTFFATLSPSAYLAIYCSAIESPPLLSLTDPNIPAVLISINIFCSYICLFLVLLFFLSWYLPFASPYILVCYTRTSWFAGRRLWLDALRLASIYAWVFVDRIWCVYGFLCRESQSLREKSLHVMFVYIFLFFPSWFMLREGEQNLKDIGGSAAAGLLRAIAL